MMETKTGEYSVKAEKITMLSKAVRPLPVPKEIIDENGNKKIFNEFKDVDTRYRERYIDMALNDDVRDVFIKRSRVLQSIREYLLENKFIEVETPTLQPIYGGANARPFTTHHNACDMTLYLRVAPELYLKRCIVGGMEKVYEIGRTFRNEGMDPQHNPEFTLMELYEAYSNLDGMMEITEAMYKYIAENVCHKYTFKYLGYDIDLSGEWKRVSMTDAIKEKTGIDFKQQMTLEEAAKLANIIASETIKQVGSNLTIENFLKAINRYHALSGIALYSKRR